MTDVLVKANTLANATVQQFSEALTTKAGAALKVVNKDIEEGVAVLAAFADRGVKGAEAGDKLNQILRDIPRATAKNKDEFKNLGLEIFDTEGNMRNVADVIEELDRVLKPMSDEMKAATLDQLGLNRGVADGIKILSGSTDQIRAYEKELRAASGTTQEIAEKQLESFKAQTQILNNTLQNLAIIIGEDIVPALEKAVQFFQTATERVVKFKEGQADAEGSAKKFKLAVIGLVAVLGPLAPVATAVGIAIAGIVKFIGKGNEEFRKNQELTHRTVDIYRRMRNQYHETSEEAGDFVETTKTLDEILDGTNFTVAELTQLLDENGIALNDNAKEALETAQAYEDGLFGGLQSVIQAFDQLQAIQDRIDRAETKRNKEVQNRIKADQAVKDATTELEKAQQKLNDVKGLGAIVTAEEELAILRQEQAIQELKDAEELSAIQKLELQILEQGLIKLREDSVALSREEQKALDDVKRAEETLTRAKDLQKEAIDRVAEAQKELNKLSEKSARNLLEQAIAQENLTKALAGFSVGTKGYEDALEKLARITGEKIGEINGLFGSLFNNASSLSKVGIDLGPSTNGGGGTGGGTPQKFPATTTTTATRPNLTASMLGETNINIFNQGTNVGTSDEFIESVSTAFQEAKKRGVEFI